MYWLAAINLLSVAVCVLDKLLSKRKKPNFRISEKTLFIISIAGGSVGMYITMLIIRHKTRHKNMMIGLPAIMLVQAAAVTFLLRRFYLSG